MQENIPRHGILSGHYFAQIPRFLTSLNIANNFIYFAPNDELLSERMGGDQVSTRNLLPLLKIHPCSKPFAKLRMEKVECACALVSHSVCMH